MLLFCFLLLCSSPSLAFRWYRGLICVCFGFKRKINSKEVSRGHWPGQSQSKVDYWLSCRQHGFHIGTSVTRRSHLYYVLSENQSQDLKCGRYCRIENTFIHIIHTLFSAQEMGVGVILFILGVGGRCMNSQCLFHETHHDGFFFLFFLAMLITKCESINWTNIVE